MATRRPTRPYANPTASFDGMMRLSTQTARFSLDLYEASAKSFIAHQMEVANLKRHLTTIAVSMARQSLT